MTITIVGIGLIGGSMAIDLKESGFADRIIGVDLVEENLNKALRRKIIDDAMSLPDAIDASSVILLATPVDALKKLIPEILDQLNSKQVLIEVGSTKEILLQEVKGHANRKRLVASHPMAGTEFKGPEAAIPQLFKDKCCVIVDRKDSANDAIKLTEKLYQHLGMSIVDYDAASHDLHAAYVSHISHISSFALALTVLNKEKDEDSIFDLAGGGFSSTVRLAKSSAEMWVPIFKQNRDNVLDVLDEHINSLAKFRSLLIKKDFAGLEKLIHQSNDIKSILR